MSFQFACWMTLGDISRTSGTSLDLYYLSVISSPYVVNCRIFL